MKKVLFTISDSFPYGAAYAARTRALCKLFQSVGYETLVLCDYLSEASDITDYGKIIAVSNKKYEGVSKLIKLPFDYAKKMDQILKSESIDLILSRSMFDRFDKVLKKARENNVPIILESCEWYDIKGFARGKYDIRYWQFMHCFSTSYNRVDGVIAISKLLEEHYKANCRKVIRIPGIHEIDKLEYRDGSRNDNTIKLLFAGNIYGGKEQFEDLIVALARIKSVEKQFILNVYGPSKEAVLNSLGETGKEALKKIENIIVFHGMISQDKMPRVCAENDFGIFFRPSRRSSHAGFPTKLGEYLAAGTPVITNNTGDISMVVENAKNGYLLVKGDSDEIYEILKKCLMMSDDEFTQMRRDARRSAERLLNYSSYKTVLEQFVKEI